MLSFPFILNKTSSLEDLHQIVSHLASANIMIQKIRHVLKSIEKLWTRFVPSMYRPQRTNHHDAAIVENINSFTEQLQEDQMYEVLYLSQKILNEKQQLYALSRHYLALSGKSGSRRKVKNAKRLYI